MDRKDLPSAREAIIKIAGAIMCESWQAEQALEEVQNAANDVGQKIIDRFRKTVGASLQGALAERIEDKLWDGLHDTWDEILEPIQQSLTKFRAHIDTCRDLLEALPIKNPNKELPQ